MDRRFIFHALFTENFVNGRMEVSMGKTVEKVFISEAEMCIRDSCTHYAKYGSTTKTLYGEVGPIVYN